MFDDFLHQLVSGRGLVVDGCRLRSRGPGFASRSVRYSSVLATLGKLLTHRVLRSTQPFGVDKSSTSLPGWGYGRTVTSVGWQVTLCDPIWQVKLWMMDVWYRLTHVCLDTCHKTHVVVVSKPFRTEMYTGTTFLCLILIWFFCLPSNYWL